MVGKTERITKKDQARFDALKEIGCIPCALEGVFRAATIQHVTDAGRRCGHQHSYGSCDWHHLGVVPKDCEGRVAKATMVLGPSLHHDKAAFERQYGEEPQLVQIADALVRAVQKATSQGWFYANHQIRKLAKDLRDEIVHGIKPSAQW